MNEHSVGVKYNERIKMGWKKFELWLSPHVTNLGF